MAGPSLPEALFAALAQVLAGGASLASGSWCTAVDCGRERYLRIQVFGLARTLVTTAGVALLALGGLGPARALIIVSFAQVVLELSRFVVTRAGEPRDVKEAVPARQVLREGRGSLVYAFAVTTQNGLQPYVTAALSPSVVSVAVPGRTLANSTRTLSTAIFNVVWVPVAARFAELTDGPRRHAFWSRNAPLLSLVQLAGVAALLALAPLVVPHWLPSKADDILRLLPLYCVEQGAYAASLPVLVLALANGRFGLLGAVTLASATVSIVGTLVFVPSHGAVGFAAANAVAGAVVAAPLLIAWEWRYWREQGVVGVGTTGTRALLLLASIAISIAHWRSPRLGVCLSLVLVAVVGGAVVRSRRRVTA